MDFDASSERGDASPVPYRSRPDLPSERGGDRGLPPSYGAPARWDDDGELDWRRYLHVLWRRKLWIALATVLGIGAGVLLTRTVDPVYETRSTIWVESSDDQTGPIEAEEVFEGRGWSDLFTSYAVLIPVVQELNLYLDRATRNSPLAESLDVADDVRSGSYRLVRDSTGESYRLATESGEVIDRGPLDDAFGRQVGIRWSPDVDPVRPGASVSFDVVTPVQAALELRGSLTALYDPRAGNLITTILRWNDPAEGARIHNHVVTTFLEVAADLKSQKLREVVDILERQTDYAEERLAEAELELERARVENITLPTEPQASPIPGAESTRGPVFDAYFEKRLQADQLRRDLESLTSVLETQESGGELDVLRLRSVPAMARSGELQSSLDDLAEMEAQRRSLLYTYTEQHPRVEDLDQRITTLRERTIPDQIRRLAADLRSEIQSLQGGLQAQESELRQIPPRLIEEERLRREMQQAEELHTNLLNRLKSAELAASTSRPNLQVVDRAQPPFAPTSNEGPRLFLLASVAGLGLGVAGALLHDRMDNSVREPEEVERRLGLPVLGLVPRLPSRGSDRAATHAVLESFRGIRAQLAQFLRPGRATVLVTSPEPRDGKSLVAANLAISFASSRKRTLLIDGDTRRGNAERLFDLESKPGLTDCLTNGTPLAAALRATDVPGLALLPHGRLRGFDPDMLDSPEMDALLEDVRQRFDVIVMDGPPLAAGPDAALLGQRSDRVLLVLRTGTTDRDVARTRLEGLAAFDLPLVGAVLNDVPDTAPYYRYYAPYQYYLEEGEVVA